jgi:phosphoglucosamine mutase
VLRFGTDGVRGDADTDLTPELVFALGRAAARVLGAGTFAVGRDTRASGPRIEADFAAGVRAEGGGVLSLGVLPTPGIAWVAQAEHVPAAVVSASHNPWTDNGVKLLAAGGRKLADDVEAAVEAALDQLVGDGAPGPRPSEPPVVAADSVDGYVAHLVGALEGRTLRGLRVVLDCANGAAFEVGPRALRAAGAEVSVVHAAPDGRNINHGCGSTDPASLQDVVRARRADVGLALDGDADRVIAVDERGEVVDGDQIMTALALDLHERAQLPGDAVAVTVMSNLGLRVALAAAGVRVVETPVGDRSVLAALDEHGLGLGGEQSGHVILPRLATTGDGLLTGLLLCDLALRTGRPVSALAASMPRFPQRLVNVRLPGRPDLDRAESLWREVRAVERELGARGRVLVRASGTEPVVRVMVEAASEPDADAAAARLRRAVEAAFAAGEGS